MDASLACRWYAFAWAFSWMMANEFGRYVG
jgi:hypothetical protein